MELRSAKQQRQAAEVSAVGYLSKHARSILERQRLLERQEAARSSFTRSTLAAVHQQRFRRKVGAAMARSRAARSREGWLLRKGNSLFDHKYHQFWVVLRPGLHGYSRATAGGRPPRRVRRVHLHG